MINILDIPDNARISMHCKAKRHVNFLPCKITYDGKTEEGIVPIEMLDRHYLPHVDFSKPYTGKQFKQAFQEWQRVRTGDKNA
ncbi:MAG: hypothetical protein ABIG30_01835 [Candidatus Aenigmatarchaeota archaeon]